MTKVFISYSRKDKEFAVRFTEALQKSELETWIDWEDIPPTADWLDQIHKGIEQADGFLFILSPDSVLSKVCGQEVDHAVQNGKRLIPIVARDINPNDVHPALAKVNWVYDREQDDFDSAVNKTLAAIRTDLAWVEAHRRLQVRALEWQKRNERSLLLRGKDLHEAEEQLAVAGKKDPQPTDLQRQFVLESRRGESRTRNVIFAIGATVIIVLAFLSIFALDQRNLANDNALTAIANQNAAQTSEANAVHETNARATAQANAEEQARIALSRQLAAQADSVREKDLALALLLSKEALNVKQTSEAKSSLLQGLQISPEEFILRKTGEPVVSLAFSLNNHVLAGGCASGDIYLWDTSHLASPVSLGNLLSGQASSIKSLAFDRNGRILAAGGSDGTVIFWDVSNPATPTQLGTPLREHPSDVVRISYQQNSQTFISIGSDSSVVFWDVSTPSAPAKLGTFNLGFETGVGSVAVSPNGHLLASAGNSDSFIHLWDISNPTAPSQSERLLEGETMPVISMAFSPDGKLLVSGSMDNTILFFDISEPANPRWVGEIINISTEGVPSLAFDGRTLVSGSSSGAIYLWNVSNPSSPRQNGVMLLGHTKPVNSVIFDTSSNALASAGQDGRVALWDFYTPYATIRPEAPLLQQAYGMQNVVFSSDGNKLAAVGGFDETVILWDVSNPSVPLRLGAFPAEQAQNVKIATFGQDTNSLILIQDNFDIQESFNPTLAVWDLSEPTAPKQTEKPWQFPIPVQNITVNPKGNLLATVTEDMDFNKNITLWDISHPTKPIQLGMPLKGYSGSISDVKFGGPQNILAAVVNAPDSNETIIFWDISNPDEPKQLSISHQEQTGDISQIVINPKGNLMASWGSPDSYIRLWDLSKPNAPIQIGSPFEGNGRGKGMAVGPYSVAFNQDGTILASGGTDATLLLWDISNPKEPRRLGTSLGEHTEGINDIAFSVNGMLASLDDGGNIYLWDMDLNSWIKTACTVAHRNLTKTEALLYLNDTKYDQHPTCPGYPITD